MSLTKIVDGISVEISSEEEAAIRAEWAENEAIPQKVLIPTEQRLADLEEKISKLEAK